MPTIFEIFGLRFFFILMNICLSMFTLSMEVTMQRLKLQHEKWLEIEV